MSKTRNIMVFFLTMSILSSMIALTGQGLIQHIRFGLELRGGYEIYYTVSPKAGHAAVSQEDLRMTADILRKRVDKIGMAEPEIHLEGTNHIRLKMAGTTSSEESRSSLRDPEGLPTALTEKYSQTVGSVLGATALKETVRAGLIGIAAIFLLLIVLYRAMGGIAAFATVVYLWLLMLLFNALSATLSLSAVVAFVLGIGIAADASIICFERIREELARGKDLSKAVRNGYAGSFATIRDANLVTALAMIALFIAGIGPIQGFSITMFASILISVTTNFFLTGFLVRQLADANIMSDTFFVGRRIRIARKPQAFDFVHAGRKIVFVSMLLIVIGALSYNEHKLNLDIDFTAGTALDIDVDRPVDLATATNIITSAGTSPATVAIGGQNNTHIAARFDEVLASNDLGPIIAAFKEKYRTVEYEENTADPGVARDFAHRAVLAIVIACISIAIYLGFAFSWRVSLAILGLIIHDLLIVVALFSIFRCEIDVTFIAALLTIIGYSLNDKIVIFWRIRENSPGRSLKHHHNIEAPDKLIDRVNASIHQTLNRSIYTVLTVVIASFCLYWFACEPLQMFSLALIIGLISGALSSVYLVGPLWLSLGGRSLSQESRFYRFAIAGAAMVSVGIIASVFMWPNHAISHPVPAQKTDFAIPYLIKQPFGPLGDLTPFRGIAEDALSLVKAGNFPAAKKRIKDLESSWDDSEERLRPMNTETWMALDKSIDRVLTQLRSGTPDAASSELALKSFIGKCESLNK
jgi:preprotein translocase SecF subunit